MSAYILLIISIFLAVANNTFLHLFGNRTLRGMPDVLLFNAFTSALWIPILLCIGGGFSLETETTVIWGISHGILTSGFLLAKMLALSNGPVSLTSMIGCSSLLVSTAFGVLFFHESVTVLQCVGVLLLLTSVFLCVNPKTEGKALTRKWKNLSAAFFFCSGFVGVVFKLHQQSASRSDTNEMMIISAVTSMAVLLVASFAVGRFGKSKSFPHLGRTALLFAVLTGIFACGYNRLNIYLAGVIPSVIFFPTFNGAVIFGSSLTGVLFFREKLSRMQLSGLCLGIFSITAVAGVYDAIFHIQ